MKSSTTPKERMLKNIRKGLIEKRDNPYPVLSETPLYVANDEFPEVLFAQELSNVSGQFIFCEDETVLIEQLWSLIESRDWKKVACWNKKLQDIFRKNQFPFLATDEDFSNVETGITECEALIARNGSILISSAGASGRRLSIYPHYHIVIAYTSQLVMDLKDAFNMIQVKYADRLPSNLTVITGPSRTADIEKTLVLGAHGPKELFVFLVDDSLN